MEEEEAEDSGEGVETKRKVSEREREGERF